MSTVILQASLPWSVSHEEDRRFHRILLQTLAVCLLIGAITAYIPIPEPDTGDTEQLPPRRVHLLAEQIRPAPKPLPKPAAPVATAPVKPQSQPLPVAPNLTPRQKAASSGVLAMRDALAELHAKAPETGTRAGREDAAGEVNGIATQPSMLTANLSRTSKGIAGGIAHQSVLGATGLPERTDHQPDNGSPGGMAAVPGRIAAPQSGAVRSAEEIQEILDRNKGAMYTLYNRELRRDATLQGKLVMSITIAASGKVTRCTMLSNEVASVALERQLVALIERIDFGNKPGVPIVTTRIPIEFFPR